MIIDTHCHYNLSPLFENWHDHWQNAKEHGVVGSIVVGTSSETSQRALDIAQQEPALLPSIGIHPNECTFSSSESYIDSEINTLKTLSTKSGIVAIGECGLDYYRLPEKEAEKIKELQKKLLRFQLELAKETQLPLIIHLRDKGESAYWDFLELFKSVFTSSHPFILHCVSGPQRFIHECLDLGAYIGVAGNVTYSSSEPIRELIRHAYSEKILAETDAPFLPPQEARGKQCEPWMIQWTAEYLIKELGLTHSQLVENTTTLFPQFKKIL